MYSSSLGESLEQLAVLFDDTAQARLELRVATAALNGFGQGLLDGLVHAGAVCPGDSLSIGRKIIVEAYCEVSSHDVMVAPHRDDGTRGKSDGDGASGIAATPTAAASYSRSESAGAAGSCTAASSPGHSPPVR